MTLEEHVRKTIEDAVKKHGTEAAVARLCHIDQISLSRFRKRERTLTLPVASKIMAALAPAKPKRKKAKKAK